jgi:hypothetical protein
VRRNTKGSSNSLSNVLAFLELALEAISPVPIAQTGSWLHFQSFPSIWNRPSFGGFNHKWFFGICRSFSSSQNKI